LGPADDDEVEESRILGPQKREKRDYAERVATMEATRDERKYKSRSAKFKESDGHGSTNADKLRNKNWFMVKSKRSIQSKAGRSLVSKQKALRKKRGNRQK
jgi:hypothetical protein